MVTAEAGNDADSGQGPTISGYPFIGRYLERNGQRYHYLDEGRGDPIVMVHGNPTWSFYYRHLVHALRGDHRVASCPITSAAGLSDKPDDRYEYTLESRVDDLEALLDHLGVRENLTLVLHDWGGMIGMAYAHRHPERIKRLVILNTAAFPLPAAQALAVALRLCRTRRCRGRCSCAALTLLSRSGARGLHAQSRCQRDVRAGYLAPYDTWANRIAVHRFVQDIPLKPGDRGVRTSSMA